MCMVETCHLLVLFYRHNAWLTFKPKLLLKENYTMACHTIKYIDLFFLPSMLKRRLYQSSIIIIILLIQRWQSRPGLGSCLTPATWWRQAPVPGTHVPVVGSVATVQCQWCRLCDLSHPQPPTIRPAEQLSRLMSGSTLGKTTSATAAAAIGVPDFDMLVCMNVLCLCVSLSCFPNIFITFFLIDEPSCVQENGAKYKVRIRGAKTLETLKQCNYFWDQYQPLLGRWLQDHDSTNEFPFVVDFP